MSPSLRFLPDILKGPARRDSRSSSITLGREEVEADADAVRKGKEVEKARSGSDEKGSAALDGFEGQEESETSGKVVDEETRHEQPDAEADAIKEKIVEDLEGGTGGEPDLDGSRDVEEKNGVSDLDRKKEGADDGAVSQTNYLPTKQIIIVFVGCALSCFLILLDQTIVSTALPVISSDFKAGQQSSWVATAYLLTSTFSQILYGRFSDIFGRKFVLIFAIAIFTLGSLACALAQTMIQLIIFRAIAGLGGGGILTLIMVIISDVVSLRERGKYQGIIGVVIAIANGTGPVIGGLFSEKVTWRWCFWINLPLAGLSLVVVIFALPLKRVKGDMKQKLMKVDYLGSVLTMLGTILILIPLNWGGTQYAWGSAQVLAPLIIGIFVLVAFILWEWKGAVLPVMPLYIYKNITVSGVFIGTLANGMVFFIQLFYIPQYFQVVRGYSAILSGVLILPLVLAQTVSSFASGWTVSRTGNYQFIVRSGFAVWTIGLGLLSLLDSNTTVGEVVPFLLLTGLGGGMTFQTSLIAAQAAVPRKDMAVVTGTRNYIRQLGGTLSLAIASTIINNTLRSQASSFLSASALDAILADPTAIHSTSNSLNLTESQISGVIQAYVSGFKAAFYLALACCGVAFLAACFMLRKHSLTRKEDEEEKKKGKEWAQRHQKKGRQDVKDDLERGERGVDETSTEREVEEKEEEHESTRRP